MSKTIISLVVCNDVNELMTDGVTWCPRIFVFYTELVRKLRVVYCITKRLPSGNYLCMFSHLNK